MNVVNGGMWVLMGDSYWLIYQDLCVGTHLVRLREASERQGDSPSARAVCWRASRTETSRYPPGVQMTGVSVFDRLVLLGPTMMLTAPLVVSRT